LTTWDNPLSYERIKKGDWEPTEIDSDKRAKILAARFLPINITAPDTHKYGSTHYGMANTTLGHLFLYSEVPYNCGEISVYSFGKIFASESARVCDFVLRQLMLMNGWNIAHMSVYADTMAEILELNTGWVVSHEVPSARAHSHKKISYATLYVKSNLQISGVRR